MYPIRVPEVLIALGSNLGERAVILQSALNSLSESVKFSAVSRIYESAPMYVLDQPAFLNAVAHGETELGPHAMLELLKQTEKLLGRETRFQNGPREIDLDLIAYGDETVAEGPLLVVPHPRTPERRFVLAPAAEVAPDWELPGLGLISQLLAETNDPPQTVHIYDDAILSIHGR